MGQRFPLLPPSKKLAACLVKAYLVKEFSKKSIIECCKLKAEIWDSSVFALEKLHHIINVALKDSLLVSSINTSYNLTLFSSALFHSLFPYLSPVSELCFLLFFLFETSLKWKTVRTGSHHTCFSEPKKHSLQFRFAWEFSQLEPHWPQLGSCSLTRNPLKLASLSCMLDIATPQLSGNKDQTQLLKPLFYNYFAISCPLESLIPHIAGSLPLQTLLSVHSPCCPWCSSSSLLDTAQALPIFSSCSSMIW